MVGTHFQLKSPQNAFPQNQQKSAPCQNEQGALFVNAI